ncbi:MAG: hypothetical protein HUU57_06000 [Bdellovibrio sp.]|nr:hypothetical protein [Bdellovibrio sp.]
MRSLFPKRKWPYFVLLTLGGSLALLSFQNCARVPLESALKEADYVAPELDLKAVVCPDARSLMPESAKFVFAIDMSISNIGDWDTDPVGPGGATPPSYFDATKATDPRGERFKAVKYFLENCAGQTGAQFAVVGFSKTAGILQGSGPSAALSCSNAGFVGASQASGQLDTLKAVQDAETTWFTQWKRSIGKYLSDPNFPPISSVTSYVSALDCVEKIVVDDLTASGVNATQAYHVFLISDGVPMDLRGSGCNKANMTPQQSSDCHMEGSLSSSAYMRQAAIAKAKDLRIYGVFYGENPNVPIHLEAISRDGGTSGAMKLSSFEGNQKALCDLVISKLSVSYRPDVFSAITLTTLRRQDQLLVDSDMDGVPDSEEVKLGWDPQSPRSLNVSGVLDGICDRLGGVPACEAKRSSIVCDPNKLNSFGLSDCDYKMLSLDKLPKKSEDDWGVDSDRDGMPDYVEIIKGSNPAVADMTSDPDGDGVANLEEIQKGTDPFFADAQTPLTILNNVSVGALPPKEGGVCDYESWAISIGRLQVAGTLELGSSGIMSGQWVHSQNQHVMLIYYRLTPQNANAPVAEFYGSIVKINYSRSGKEEVVAASQNRVSTEDFVILGRVQP